MTYDGKATDKRRIQDTDGDVLDITPEGNITAEGLLLLELDSGSIGWKAQIAGSADMDGWILKKNTKYIITAENASDAAIDATIIIVYHNHNGA